MIHPDILIPTNKNKIEISPFVCYVAGFSFGCDVYASCIKASASVNRNDCLGYSLNDIVVMIDDDTRGFYLDWWKELIRPLEDPSVCLVSARLINRDGSNAPMMFQGNIGEKITEVQAVPSACIAFRAADAIMFNVEMRGSGWEDTLFCQELKHSGEGKRIVINNNVRIIHDNEQKNQSDNYAHNKEVYHRILTEKGWEDFV